MRFTKRRIVKAGLFLFLLLILIFPSAAFTGAKNGLMLWFNTLLPTLLPFMIISGLLIRLRATGIVAYLLYPVLKHILPISKNGCYPVFIGFLAGMPVGAKTCADLKQNGLLEEEESELLCAVCNNPSPMFILSYIAASQLGSPKIGLWLVLVLYLSSLLSGLFMHKIYYKRKKKKESFLKASSIAPTNDTLRFELFDESIFAAFEVVTKVGGYVLIFSVLSSLLALVPFSSPVFTIMTSGILEITTGIHSVSICPFAFPIKLILATMIAAFGGISGYAQTISVISEAKLNAKRYLLTKMISAAIATLIMTLLFLIDIF